MIGAVNQPKKYSFGGPTYFIKKIFFIKKLW